MKVVSFVGARPQFIKEALIGDAARKSETWEHILVHSGQHYDAAMSDIFFTEFCLPTPGYHLGIGSGTHAQMTAAALVGIEKILQEERPDVLLVYGDTNTTLAGALAAAKLNIPIAHVEAGIRMAPATMPEEINRVLVDRMASVHCCCSALGAANLAREGITQGVFVTGDVMYDCYLHMRPKFAPDQFCSKYEIVPDNFIVATLHRDYNVDNPSTLYSCLDGLTNIQLDSGLRIILPLHPRTRKNIDAWGYSALARQLILTDPLGYSELLSLVHACAFVITDSGGLQKEAFFAGKRALVIMPDTGWRELTECGWNILCPPSKEAISAAGRQILCTNAQSPGYLYGDGSAVEKIIAAIRGMGCK